MALKWIDITEELPDLDVPVLVETSNGKYTTTQLKEIKRVGDKLIPRWKGSYTFSESVIRWKCILTNDEIKTLIAYKLSQQNIDINTINKVITTLI